jgi:hypothetical protein
MTSAVAYPNYQGTGSWAVRDVTPVRSPELVDLLSKVRDHLNTSTIKRRRLHECEELIESFNEEYMEVIESLSDEVNHNSLIEVRELLETLPDSIPLPDLIAENDGTVAMEWYKDKRNAFVMAFKGNKTIEFASIYGYGKKKFGRETYTDSLPRSLAIDLSRFLSV